MRGIPHRQVIPDVCLNSRNWTRRHQFVAFDAWPLNEVFLPPALSPAYPKAVVWGLRGAWGKRGSPLSWDCILSVSVGGGGGGQRTRPSVE